MRKAASLVERAVAGSRQLCDELKEASGPRLRVCVRSHARAKLIHRLWPRYQQWFGEVELFVAASQRAAYEEFFEAESIRDGALGPGGQVQAMLASTPVGHWLVVLDDNIQGVRIKGKLPVPGQLKALFEEASESFGKGGRGRRSLIQRRS